MRISLYFEHLDTGKETDKSCYIVDSDFLPQTGNRVIWDEEVYYVVRVAFCQTKAGDRLESLVILAKGEVE